MGFFTLTFKYEKHPQSTDLELNCMSSLIFSCPIPVTDLPLKSPSRRQRGAAWFSPFREQIGKLSPMDPGVVEIFHGDLGPRTCVRG